MISPTYPSVTLMEGLINEIESITNRIVYINKVYETTINKNLKVRLITEHSNLKNRFKEIKKLSEFIKSKSNEKISITYLLFEKCQRSELKIFKNNNLFFV